MCKKDSVMTTEEMNISELIAYKEVCICYGDIEAVAECIKMIKEREEQE